MSAVPCHSDGVGEAVGEQSACKSGLHCVKRQISRDFVAHVLIESFAITLYPPSNLLWILSTYPAISMVRHSSQIQLKQAVHTFS